jgi:hypothetical protein
VAYNDAQGGGGNGGDGLGGGLYNDGTSTLTVTLSTVTDNYATGGIAGQGIGGGVYSLGIFAYDPTTIIKKNHASTRNDDIFSS